MRRSSEEYSVYLLEWKPKAIISTSLLVCFLLLPKVGFVPAGAEGFSFEKNLIFHFSHANIFHLLCNLMCVWSLPYVVRYLAIGFSIATLCSFLPEITVNIMGFSGILFSIAGYRMGKFCAARSILLQYVAIFIVTAFIPNVAVLYHVYCVLVSYIIGLTFAYCTLWRRLGI